MFRVNRSEPLLPMAFPDRPWQTVGMDLLQLKGKWYLLVADYYSRYLELALLESLSTDSVIIHLKSILARHGVPEVIRADCGTQWISHNIVNSKFRDFASDYGFILITSSPKYSQSNGFIESEVKNIKIHLQKSSDPYKVLLMLRTTPLSNGYSPSELLMGRKLRGLVPSIPSNLSPTPINLNHLFNQEELRRERQKNSFDRHHGSRPLETLKEGEQVYITDRQQEGVVLQEHETPRSYLIKTHDGIFRRNRKSLCRLPGNTDDDNPGLGYNIGQQLWLPGHKPPSPTKDTSGTPTQPTTPPGKPSSTAVNSPHPQRSSTNWSASQQSQLDPQPTKSPVPLRRTQRVARPVQRLNL